MKLKLTRKLTALASLPPFDRVEPETTEIEVPDPLIPWQDPKDILPPELRMGSGVDYTLAGIWSIKDTSVVSKFGDLIKYPSYWPIPNYGYVISGEGITIVYGDGTLPNGVIIVEINEYVYTLDVV